MNQKFRKRRIACVDILSKAQFKKQFPQIIKWISEDFKISEKYLDFYFSFQKYDDDIYYIEFYTRDRIFRVGLNVKNNSMICNVNDILGRGSDLADGEINKITWNRFFRDFIECTIEKSAMLFFQAKRIPRRRR